VGHIVLTDVAKAPLAIEAVRRIDVIFTIRREINGRPPERRLVIRREKISPLVTALHDWMRIERARLSKHNDVGRAMDYMIKRWPAFTTFLDDGRICLSINAAERALRGVALGRKA
jgi:transposase